MEKRITGKTGLLGLFGSPVGHSGSPAMYNYSFARLGLDYAYLAFDVTLDTLEAAVAAAKTLHMRGFNVTMPCKVEIVKYMDELSPAAKLIGAVNTVVNEDGKLYGHNTDGRGFILNLKQHGVEVRGKKLTVLGGGGAATAIQVQAALDGAAEISIFNAKDSFYNNIVRTAEKIMKEAPGCKVTVHDLNDENSLRKEIRESQILVNATRVGMKPLEDDSLVKDAGMYRKDLAVADVVYNPRETKLLQDARAAGCEKVIGGIGMLLWQGVEAFKLYTGKDMPVEEVQRLFFDESPAAQPKGHIFLIGFMGTGKSTVSACLAEMLGVERIEMDERIASDEQMAITEIFEKYGEEHFRDLESGLIRSLKEERPAVISCGGGVVLREENIAAMKEAGRVVWLKAAPQTVYERVKDSDERPILNQHMDVGYIASLMEKRRKQYERAADLPVDTDGLTAREIAGEIIRRLS